MTQSMRERLSQMFWDEIETKGIDNKTGDDLADAILAAMPELQGGNRLRQRRRMELIYAALCIKRTKLWRVWPMIRTPQKNFVAARCEPCGKTFSIDLIKTSTGLDTGSEPMLSSPEVRSWA